MSLCILGDAFTEAPTRKRRATTHPRRVVGRQSLRVPQGAIKPGGTVGRAASDIAD